MPILWMRTLRHKGRSAGLVSLEAGAQVASREEASRSHKGDKEKGETVLLVKGETCTKARG